MSKTETIVMSVGGSLIVPDAIDTNFLSTFKEFIASQTTDHGRRFIIIAGGGKTARRYQEAAAEVTSLESEDLDWMGIHATRLNGHLLRTVLRDTAHYEMINNPDNVLDINKDARLIIAAGYRPGNSTDFIAVKIAKMLGARKVVNLSNTDYIYTADPKKDDSAEKITEIAWSDFRLLIPAEWDPGLSAPFDPVAAREAEASGIEVANINGSKLEELAAYLDGLPFTGTKIF